MPRTARADSRAASTSWRPAPRSRPTAHASSRAAPRSFSTGGDQLATGAQSLADGVAKLASGSDQLATGLETATDQIPTYTDTEAADLADVVSNPVVAKGAGTSLFGASAIPLLVTAALWFGGLATFVALQAVSRRSLASRRPSALLACRAFLPAAALGALQGIMVAGIVQLAASYDWSELVAVRRALRRRGCRLRRGEPGARGRVQRRGTVDLGPHRRTDDRHRGGLDRPRSAGIRRIADADRARLQRHARGADLDIRRRRGPRRPQLTSWTLLAFGATILAVVRRRTVSARSLLTAGPVTA